MLGAAAGWNEDKFLKNLKKILYGVTIIYPGEIVQEIARIFKSNDSPIYPINKRMVYKPSYDVFIASDDLDMMNEIYSGLQDPKYVLSLGDSENLFYPKNKYFAEIMDIVESSSNKFRCILPKEIYETYYMDYSKIDDYILPPKETKIPVDFIGKGKKRRFIARNVIFYSGIEINMKEKITKNVWDFNGSKVYLF
jgi:CRISPR-associated protein Cas5h